MHLKILQVRLQQYMNCELPDVQAGFRKRRGTRDQFANIRWRVEKARELQKTIYFCFIDYAKAFNCVDHNKLCKILQEMGIPDHLTCLLRNLYAGQEAKVKTGDGTADWFQMGKWIRQGCGITALFSWVLVHTRFFCVCALQESVSLVLGKFFNQIPLPSKDKFWTVWKGKTIWPER